jgi:flavin reductase (DIM6/NTAB) family NADH-FMN oxidoreductase RutF
MPVKKKLPLGKVYQLIEPGPVVMITTTDKTRNNIMTLSWKTMIDFEPPILAIVMSNQNYSFDVLKKTKECVINIPTIDLLKQTVGVGNCTGATTDKFKKFHLTPVPASHVHPPLIDECYANLECKIIDTTLSQKYEIFVLEVVAAWIWNSKKRPLTFHHHGNGMFIRDGKVIKMRSGKK